MINSKDLEEKKIAEFDLFRSWLPLHIKRLQLQKYLRCKQHLYFLPLDQPFICQSVLWNTRTRPWGNYHITHTTINAGVSVSHISVSTSFTHSQQKSRSAVSDSGICSSHIRKFSFSTTGFICYHRSWQCLSQGRRCIFQQDNARHSASITTACHILHSAAISLAVRLYIHAYF